MDPQGRLVIGSLSLDEARRAPNWLIRLESDATLTVLDEDLGLSNGLGWSPDGSYLYSVDTIAQRVYRRRYGTANVGPREEFILFGGGGYPDGLAVDADGNLWIAVWGGAEVQVFAADGRRREDLGVSIEAPHASSIAFVGDQLDTVIITSASRDLTPAERTQFPFAGGLFSAQPGPHGQAATPWRETALPQRGLNPTQDHRIDKGTHHS